MGCRRDAHSATSLYPTGRHREGVCARRRPRPTSPSPKLLAWPRRGCAAGPKPHEGTIAPRRCGCGGYPNPAPCARPEATGMGSCCSPTAGAVRTPPSPVPTPRLGPRFLPLGSTRSPHLWPWHRRVPMPRSAPRVAPRPDPAGLCPGLGAHRRGPTALISRPGESGLAGAGGDQPQDAGAVLAHLRRRSAPDLHADAQRLLPSLPELCHIQIAAPERLPLLLGVLKGRGDTGGDAAPGGGGGHSPALLHPPVFSFLPGSPRSQGRPRGGGTAAAQPGLVLLNPVPAGGSGGVRRAQCPPPAAPPPLLKRSLYPFTWGRSTSPIPT